MEWRVVLIVVGMALLVAVAVAALVDRPRRAHHRPDAALSEQFTSLSNAVERVQGLVWELTTERSVHHAELMTRLETADRSDVALRDATDALVRTFAHPAARGRWGERSAADVLRRAGLVEGIGYVRQRTLPNGSRPDVTFFLPHDRVLHLDVKFPVDNYLRHVDATDDSERQRTRQAFVADVAGQLKELHRRGYTEGPDSVDHLLMYLPSEAVFGFLCEHGPDLIDSALDRGIILCSPFTLLSVLTVVRESVEQFCLERRTDEILEVLRGFDQQWRRFGECIDRVDRHLTTLSNSFGELSGPRRRGLDAAVASISGVTDPSVAVDDR